MVWLVIWRVPLDPDITDPYKLGIWAMLCGEVTWNMLHICICTALVPVDVGDPLPLNWELFLLFVVLSL